jgi:chaperonin GroES
LSAQLNVCKFLDSCLRRNDGKITRYELQTNMKLKPLGDHIIVKPIVEDQITKAGIVLPETVDKEKPEKGIVEAVGQGKLLENGQRAVMSVKVGDKVMFKKYSPDEVKIDGVEYLIISESDILAILE